MKTVAEILEWIEETMEHEKERMQEIKDLGCGNTVGWGMACGSHEALLHLKEFIEE
jgi:hypothetical protein